MHAQENFTRQTPPTQRSAMNLVADLTDEQKTQAMPPVKPWQRLACMLYASSTPLSDVALEVNMPLNVVTNFVTSPQGTEILRLLVSENPDRMGNIIEATALDSILVMVRLRDCGKTESVQLSASGQLLDRFFPKTKATDGPKGNRPAEGFVDVQAEIAKLREKMGRSEHDSAPVEY